MAARLTSIAFHPRSASQACKRAPSPLTRSSPMGRPMVRRADIPDHVLEREVKKRIDENGDFKGEFPEQPEMISDWHVDYGQNEQWSIPKIYFAYLLLFGSLMTVREILNYTSSNLDAIAVPRDDAGEGYNDYGAEYLAEQEALAAEN
eukprot:TRINITY_DN9625_c0_g1_i1.p1 TRINITY_DN9625_c0_g1~~TRINITY_DN9625_c0_g1_i1.p1  ORF type:complete len:148 (-),score=38.34 TRINITY_DN9625_c0_g1_i1:99-542(-)